MTVERAPAPRGAHWLALSDSALERLRDEAHWLFGREVEEPVRRQRHLMNIVLFEQLGALRQAVRRGTLPEALAPALMHSAFADGYLTGLVARYVEASGVEPGSVHAHAARRDVMGHAFGWAEPAARPPWRGTGPEFAAGLVAAREDARTMEDWLLGLGTRFTFGLRDGLLRLLRRQGAWTLH